MADEVRSFPTTITALVERIRGARAALEAELGRHNEDALTRPGPDGGWAVKDHLAHIAEWCWKLLAMIEGKPGYVGLKIDEQEAQTLDLDGINKILYLRHRDQSAGAVLAEFRRAHEAVLWAVERLADADLQRDYDLTDPTDPRRLVEGIAGNTYEHDEEHLSFIREIVGGEEV